jgi:sugar lactone lactonase YvrE
VAGNGIAGFGGDGGIATAAQLNSPVCVHVDAANNLYIADLGNQRVRRVSTSGIITTIAGNGTAGFSGDGGAAASAQLNAPRGVAADAAGNILIADAGNHCIRKINTLGVISTIAGTPGINGFSGDGGPATAAKLYGPYSVATDGTGNIYIADVDNQRIRKIDAAGNISTIAGSGVGGYSGDGGPATVAQLYEPIAVAADAVGNVYIADGWNNRIRIVNAAGNISTIAGTGTSGYSGDGGLAVSAQLNNPYGVAVDNAGNIYIADYGNNRIRRIAYASEHLRLEVFPNPVRARASVMVSSGTREEVRLVVTDIVGRMVKEFNGRTNSYIEIGLDEIAAGIYSINANTSYGSISKRLVVTH